MSSNDSEDARGKPPASSRPRPNRPLSTAQRVRDYPETGDDPREEVLSKRPQPGPRPANSRRPSATDEMPRAKPARNGSSSNGNAVFNGHDSHSSNGASTNGASTSNGSSSNGSGSNGHQSNGSSNGSSSNGNSSNGASLPPPAIDESPGAAAADNAHDDGTPKRFSRRSKPNGMIVAPEESSSTPAPVTRPIPATAAATTISTALAPAPPPAPLTGPPMRIDPGMMPAPAALAPRRLPKAAPLPALFDHESNGTGPIAFDRLFDTDHDPSGAIHAPRAARQRTMMFTQTGRRSRPRIRRVTRVVRHVDPWSVFKVALCFSIVLYGVCLTAGVLLWNVAYTTGTIDNVQRFFESFGWDTFRFKGGELFHNAWIAGLFASLGLTGLIVLTATLFNLITDLVGGIRVTVLEEEVVERNPVVRGPLLRRRTRPVTGIMGDASRQEGYPDDGDSMDSPLPFG